MQYMCMADRNREHQRKLHQNTPTYSKELNDNHILTNQSRSQSVQTISFENEMFKTLDKVMHLPVDSTNGKRDLRFVSRLRTETTAALPGKDRMEHQINIKYMF